MQDEQDQPVLVHQDQTNYSVISKPFEHFLERFANIYIILQESYNFLLKLSENFNLFKDYTAKQFT